MVIISEEVRVFDGGFEGDVGGRLAVGEVPVVAAVPEAADRQTDDAVGPL